MATPLDVPPLVRERATSNGVAGRQWGFIERVSTGLANVRDFAGDGGMAFLEVAERCL